jgi:hypothetical protein
MNVFIHHDGALGDVILSLPCIDAIRKESSFVHFAGRADVGLLLRETGCVDEASSSGSARYASVYAGEAGNGARTFLSGFDRAVVFTVNSGSALTTSLRAIIPRTETIITIPLKESQTHAAEFRMTQFVGDAHAGAEPLLRAPRRFEDMAAMMLSRAGYGGVRYGTERGEGRKPLIAVHPGSGGKAKRWPLEFYFELIERLRQSHNAFAVIFTGPAEEGTLRESVEAFCRNGEGVKHIADAELTAVAALLGQCDLYIGNDSGVSHLAAALGCPVVALFGPTDPRIWKPAGRSVHVLSAASMAEITVDMVRSVVVKMLTTASGYPDCVIRK